MSNFQVSVTPTRIQNQRKYEEIRVPTIVVLALFTPKSVVDFTDIPVTKTARRCLKIQNPTVHNKSLHITKILNPEYNAQFSWTNAIVEANSEIELEIEWTPMREFSGMETIQFTDDHGFKKDVSIVLKSVMVVQKTKRVGLAALKPAIKQATQLVTKPATKPKLKSGSPKKCAGAAKPISPLGVRRRSFSTGSIHVRKFQQAEKVIEKTTTSSSRISNVFDFNDTVENNKENKNPTTSPNASELFDQIQFTPITETRSKVVNKYDYLASCPTPGSLPRYDNSLKSNNLTPFKLQKPSNENINHNTANSNKSYLTGTCETPKSHHVEKVFEPEVFSTVARNMQMIREHETLEITETHVCYEEQIYNVSVKNETFEYLSSDGEPDRRFGDPISLENLSTETYVKSSPSNNPILSVTQPLSTPQLSIIDEENRSGDNGKLAKTYNLIEPELGFTSPAKAHSNDNLPIPYMPTPIRKMLSLHDMNREDLEKSQKKKFMKCAQGSMPNLNGDGVKMIDSIENNRFYPTRRRSPSYSGIQRNLDTNIVFSENEICAQSSLFNLNEPEPSKRYRTFSDGHIVRRSSLDKIQQIHKSVRMVITPPKHKPERDDYLNSRAQPIRSNNWGKSIDKMIKPLHTLVLKRKQNLEPIKPIHTLSGSSSSISSSTSSVSIYATPRRNKVRRNSDSARVPLFDPELYNQAFINPDPFAATTTCDPFLSITFYLDQRSVEEHEKQFKKWLNALVTIPDDIEAEQKIDLGKLFQDVKNKELQYAQTKEKISSKYFTEYRMISLRKVAFDLYRSNDLQFPISKVLQLIEKKQLAIRTDRNLHLDLVLQRNILELLLSFNPLWLRIALEIMFNEEIPMTSNSDIYSLSAFIINRLFRGRFSGAKHSKSFAYSQNYAEHIKAEALKYILILILFLDKAKEKRIIKHNPCLFARNSKFKETREVLIQFSSSLVANLGDITKYLKRIGYVLTHKQTYLDEFDYAFKNLAVDLRDGVRLTRVMEIILMRDDLSNGLRVPAISRLQKLHNVEIALKALAAADFHIMGGITAKDIVEGHREKTLSLLWQIIYKFRAPRFNAAAITLQRWWRHKYLKLVINKRVTERIEKRRNYAATRIQSIVRSYLSRKRTERWLVERRNATVTLQTYIRRYQCRKRFLLIRKVVRHIQTWYRSQMITITVRKEFLLKRSSSITIQKWYRRRVLARKLELAAPIIRSLKSNAKLRYEKAVFLQRVIKAFLIRKRFHAIVTNVIEYQKLQKDRNHIATRIQSYFKMYVERKRYEVVRNSIIKLQAAIRAKLARDRFIKIRDAAICIQKYYRNYLVGKRSRIEYGQLRKSIITIQRIFRANQKMKQNRQEYLKILNSCVIIQNWCRATMKMRNTRNEYLKMRINSVTIQKYFRGYQEMKRLRNEFLARRVSATKIQERYKAWHLMKKQRVEYLKLRKACVCLQSNYRCIVARRQYILAKKSATLIQQKWRAMIIMRNERTKYLALQKSVCLIQRKFRSKMQMMEQKKTFTKLRESTVVLQRQVKAYFAMRKQREMYILLRSSTITIQVQFRALLQMRYYRQQYVTIRRCTVKIQKYFRGYLKTRQVRHEYLQTRTSCIKIQSVIRQYIHRKQYLTLRKSATTLQTQWRAMLEMRTQRSCYNKLRNSVIFLQHQFRANKKMEKCRAEYIALRSGTVTIQQHYRALILMRKTRTEYNLLRSSVICIQNRLRAQNRMLVERRRYNKMKMSAITIQKYFRGYCQMKEARNNFETQKISAIKIQTAYRGFVERRAYHNLRKTVVILQMRWRAILAMRKARLKYLLMRKSIILIQRRFRANKQMIMEHKNFVEIKQAANTIQQRWKALVTMRQERERYILIRSSTITIQTYYRAIIAMRYERRQYILIRKSTICIQRYIRGYQLMKSDRKLYLNERNAIIKVQSLYRSLIQRRNYIKIRHSVILLQTRYRALLTMREDRQRYITIKTSVITIQRFFRCYLQMKVDQNSFKTQKLSAIKIQSHIRGLFQRRNYLKLKMSALVIQQRYRAQLEMRTNRHEYLKIQKSVKIIQTHYRNCVLSRQIRKEFIIKRDAAIKIQSVYRGYIQRSRFIKIITSVRVLQIQLQATLAMKKQSSYYQTLKKSTLLVQCQYRSIRKMRESRTEYLSLRRAAITIQQRYRAQILMKYTRIQYLLIQAMVICIQRKFRAQRLMKVERLRFEKMRYSAMVIQQRFRATRLMRVEREIFLKTRKSIVLIQSGYRALIARLKFREMWLAVYSPEAIERRRQKNAAIQIQKLWRGYIVRKRHSKKLNTILKSIKSQAVNKKEPVKFCVKTLVRSLRVDLILHFNIALPIFTRLDNLTRLVPHIFLEDAEYVAHICYQIMASSIRSEPDKIIIEFCSRIILNLARFEQTTDIAFQVNGLVTIAQMLLRWSDKECEIFNTLCTLVWVFVHCPKKNRQIRRFMTTDESKYTLREAKKLMKRKENMRKNVKLAKANQADFSPRDMPHFAADFGVIKGKPYIFQNQLFAFDVLLEKLNITDII